METYLALDFGGTKLLAGEVDEDGKILRYERYETGYVDQESAVRIISDCLEDYMKHGWYGSVPAAAGIGIIGRVDARNGIWLEIDPGRSKAVDLAAVVKKVTGLSCRADNDVKAAVRAELKWGAGRDCANFIYLNVGTGIAAGAVENGRIIRGGHWCAGEVGHVSSCISVGTQCVCGRRDCVETIASGIGFDMCARLLAGKYESPLQIPETGRVDVREVYRLANEGDKLCSVLVDNAAEAIAGLVMDMVRMSDPEKIILGGGIVSDSYMLDKVKANMPGTTMRFVTSLEASSLDPAFAGLLGAAAVAADVMAF